MVLSLAQLYLVLLLLLMLLLLLHELSMLHVLIA
jgi:hypothetical protein